MLSAALLAPPFLAACYVGGWIFLAAVGALTAAAGWEYCRMALPGRRAALALVVTFGLGAAGLRFARPDGDAHLLALLTVVVLASLVVGLAAGDPAEGARVACLSLLGALWTGWLFAFLVGLRELPRVVPGAAYRAGFVLVAAPVALAWVSDVGAYFAGRAWGRRKLLPRVSPGKTVAGALGGMAASAGAGALLLAWAPEPLPRAGLALGGALGAAASALAQTGDLAESLLKRAFGVKDSSRLIPGHGGVLDRFDALLFVAPAAYHLLRATLR